MDKSTQYLNEILIVNIIPYFLEKESSWYPLNYAKIKNAARSQIWWKDNTLFLEKDLRANLYVVLRQIVEFGYNKVQTLGAPGEFAQRGGVLDVFPINSKDAFRIEFDGAKIATISFLPIQISKSQKAIKKELAGRQPQELLYNLKPSDYLVHLDHGIGVFLGFAEKPDGKIFSQPPPKGAGAPRANQISVSDKKELPGLRAAQNPAPKPRPSDTPEGFWCAGHDKFFVLEYAKKDRLYVPLDLENKLSRYIGFETPIVHRLGGTLWFKTKRKARANALELAKELLELYAKRAAARGFKYPPDDELQKELESDFQYIETDDQNKVIQDVKNDMESPKPMDRLICGDVGFGKTEVALRAAFKAVAAGKQVTLLAPTTILANQHFQTFGARLKKFPLEIALLTRLQTKKQQQKTIKDLSEGKADILIGTHRLLSGDVQFKNLGLLIIDEEQRFGVRQKEKIKNLRAEIDILSLTATPIPRTMNLALSGLRDISIIGTPPPGRLAIKTFVQPFNQKIIKEAISRELKRDGQIYYLHNRVETIELAAQQIKKLEPKAKIAAIHGRLPEKNLVKIMDDFGQNLSPSFLKEGWGGFKKIPLNPPLQRGKSHIDILVATTIIENGLDFPNVNTLIVANATRLGLAQAYQIRGRIGRSHHQAYAYFLYSSKHLTDEAQQRLTALKEAEALGSGYQIALRDLEIRGAGNILGREQSGPVNAVGLNLYMQMLNEAVEEMKK
jgi:transcription-repair coupling factor (superfamily II helicase)